MSISTVNQTHSNVDFNFKKKIYSTFFHTAATIASLHSTYLITDFVTATKVFSFGIAFWPTCASTLIISTIGFLGIFFLIETVDDIIEFINYWKIRHIEVLKVEDK